MRPPRVKRPTDDAALVLAVSGFLAWEATLLDDGRFDDWLDLLTDDVCYRVACRPAVGGSGADGEQTPPWYLDEDRTSLGQRVARMAGGIAWAETPPSRTQRLVTGVLAEPTDDPVVVLVRSSLLLHRVRLEREVETYAGTRHDVLRRDGDGFWLAAREVMLAAPALPGKSLSLFL